VRCYVGLWLEGDKAFIGGGPPSDMGRTRIDHSRYARGGFLAGVTIFALGILGHAVGPAVFGPLPAWELTLFALMEGGGILLALCSPIVFAIVLPLIE
jgi:hypothetical protein